MENLEGREPFDFNEIASDRGTPNFKDEVAGLFELLDKHTRHVDETHRDREEEKAFRLSKWSTLVTGAIIGIVFLIAKFAPVSFWLYFKNPMVVIQGLILLAYIVAAIYLIIELYSMRWSFSFLKNPTQGSLKGLGRTVQEEVGLFKYLDDYSAEAISYVCERLKYNHERVSTLKSYFVGAIEKVGLIPGFLVTIAGLVGALNGEGWLVVYALSIAISAMVGLYLVIVPAVFASIRMKQFGFIFDQYLRLNRKETDFS